MSDCLLKPFRTHTLWYCPGLADQQGREEFIAGGIDRAGWRIFRGGTPQDGDRNNAVTQPAQGDGGETTFQAADGDSPHENGAADGDCPQEKNPGQKRRTWTAALLRGGVFAATLAVVLVGASGLAGGKSLAARAATDLAMPVGILWLLMLALAIACASKHRRRGAICFTALWIAVGISFNGLVAERWMKTLEFPIDADPLATDSPPFDAVVVLGGYAQVNLFGITEVGCDAQRIVLAAQLWHAGKTKSILCTGSGPLGAPDASTLGRQLLRSLGVPNRVIFESFGENTSAEMAGLRLFFDSPPQAWQSLIGTGRVPESNGLASDSRSLGLVTSAFHMPRALRLAAANQLTFSALPCAFQSGSSASSTPRDLIPTAAAGRSFAIATKEFLAAWVGR
ncbi:YdcF family protein [Stieleria sp. TO1_6]|uniref:YdcF family protein n=1 Tax=Stieleria tagensis TaxID=2956795 RepID=UPI00209B70B2|nr:YdcF family protein [Stieleria tagensis]MCO8120936.1 YdcF family protein [Stieleria tagensis]